jgi:phosphoribosylanthranilate isomerase
MTLLTNRHTFDDLEQSGTLLVKTCGIMRVSDALASVSYGADMLGLVFARSRRTVSGDFASSVRGALNDLKRSPLLVGVFVNESPEAMLAIADKVGLDILQLSGDETPYEVAQCAAHYPVLKAFRFSEDTGKQGALRDFARYRQLVPEDRLRFLVDTYRAGEYGGTGEPGNWGMAAELARHEDILLAGGLTARNVSEAIGSVAPWGVDVSSGIERDGNKDPALIRSFIEGARGASRPMVKKS